MDGNECKELDRWTKQCKECVPVPVTASHAPLSPNTTDSSVQKDSGKNSFPAPVSEKGFALGQINAIIQK